MDFIPRKEVILMRLILCGVVACALLAITASSADAACGGRGPIRKGLRAAAYRVTHPFNGRFRR